MFQIDKFEIVGILIVAKITQSSNYAVKLGINPITSESKEKSGKKEIQVATSLNGLRYLTNFRITHLFRSTGGAVGCLPSPMLRRKCASLTTYKLRKTHYCTKPCLFNENNFKNIIITCACGGWPTKLLLPQC